MPHCSQKPSFPNTERLAAKLWSRVDRVEGGCWAWQGAVHPRYGAGQFGMSVNGKTRTHYAHRVAWELTQGPIPAGMCVVRTCRNARCCNPDHMAVVTRAEAGRLADGGAPLTDVTVRFWQKVRKSPDCWTWTGTLNQAGYGVFSAPGGRPQHKAHRYAYELVIGPIPDGLVLDHLCRNTSCVNPAHLEPVTNVENVLRGYSVPAIRARARGLLVREEIAAAGVVGRG